MSSVLQKQVGLGFGVLLATGAEVVAAYTGRCEVPLPTVRAIVKAWAQFKVGAAATGLTLRIRRGNGVTGAVAGGQTPIMPYAANFTGETVFIIAESLQNAEYADYSFTLTQQGAAGDGTCYLAAIEVELING